MEEKDNFYCFLGNKFEKGCVLCYNNGDKRNNNGGNMVHTVIMFRLFLENMLIHYNTTIKGTNGEQSC